MLKIALAQMKVYPGDPRRNVTVMRDYIGQAKEKHCQLIIFPELAVPGYLIGDIWDQPDFINECVRLGDEIKDLSQDITIIFGNVATDPERINPDGRQRKYNATD